MSKTEHDMQAEFTKAWSSSGLNYCNTKLFLAAWEVMTSWKINDSKMDWTKPSIDFVFLDQHGSIWLMEMKREIKSERDSYAACCQVSHRAMALKRTFTVANLSKAHSDCYSGMHGRVEHQAGVEVLLEVHKNFYKLPMPLNDAAVGQGVWRRIVSANTFHHSWDSVQKRFNEEPVTDLQDKIKQKYKLSESTKEFNRFIKEIVVNDWSWINSAPIGKFVLLQGN